MPQILISLLDGQQSFSLTGDIDVLKNRRSVRLYLVDFLHATISETEIIIPYEEDKERLIKDIQELLSDNGIEEKRSTVVEDVLEQYFSEENKFNVFSEQARSIRNNELTFDQKIELSIFTDTLLTVLPRRRLYELQLLSAYHMAFSQNACNFSVPGSGKTSIVYGAYAYLKQLPITDPKHVCKLMIIGPLSSFGPWEMEFEECFGTTPRSKRLAGGVSKEDKIHHFYGSDPAEITLLSYNAIPGTFDDIVFFLKKHHTMVVLDEAHKIKNIEGGIWANAALDIARFCSARVVLTGTPAPNGYEDIYNLFKFIWPTKEIIKYYPFHLKEMSDNPADKRIVDLIEEISPYFIRIRKSDLHLPDPIENQPIIVEMGDVQRNIYNYIEKNYLDYFLGQAADSTSVRNLLTRSRLIRLMQASTNPSLLIKPLEEFYIEQGYSNELFIDDTQIFNEILDYHEIEIPPKFIAAKELINKLLQKNERVIVWTVFIKSILDFREFLEQGGIPSKSIYGATPIEGDETEGDIETRESIIREFHDENCPYKVLVANPFAIAESISLHKACHNAIYLDRTFNAGNFIQSKDRIHRYGLKPNDRINYFYILSDNNIDRTIHQRLREKEERMLRIIESQPIPLFNILDLANEEDQDLRVLINNYVNKSKPIH